MRDGFDEAGYVTELFADCVSFFQSYRPLSGACLLIDALTLEAPGFGLMDRLRFDELPTIVMSANPTLPMAVQAMRAGAVDFLGWPFGSGELFASVARALDETQGAIEQSAFRRSACRNVARLTARQHEIMDLVVAGHPSKNIAADLGISQRTVEAHRANIASKTGARSLPAMIHTALCANCSLGASVDR
jgi:two-component system CheB/CheR fusion protein